ASRLGLEHSETLAALDLTSAPAGGDSFEVREVRTLEDYIQAQRVDARANGWPEGADEEYARFWEVARDRFIAWVAFDRGRPVGMARCATAEQALMMVGGAVLPEERGRGIYRALVAARWATAVERGVPALVTAANEQSAPSWPRTPPSTCCHGPASRCSTGVSSSSRRAGIAAPCTAFASATSSRRSRGRARRRAGGTSSGSSGGSAGMPLRPSCPSSCSRSGSSPTTRRRR